MEIILFQDYKSSDNIVMETKTINDIPELIYRRDRMSLPFDPNDRLKGQMVFILNTSPDAVAKLLHNEHKFIKNPGKIYNTYFYDHTTLRGSLKCEKFNIPGITVRQAKMDRISKYDLMQSKVDGIYTPSRLELTKNKNMIYDLQPVADYMAGIERLTKLPILGRLKTYFHTLYGLYEKPYGSYKKNMILVNVDEFQGDATLDNYQALLYLLTLFTRSESSMESFRIPMEFLFYTEKGCIRFNLKNDLTKKNFSKFRSAIRKMQPKLVEDIEEKIIRAEVVNSFNVKMGLTGDMRIDPDDQVATTITNSVRQNLDDANEGDTPEDEADIIDGIGEEVEEDPELKEEIVDILISKKGRSASKASIKRDALLRERQNKIVVKTKTLGELKEQLNVPEVKEDNFNIPEVINPEITKVKFDNFEKTYNETTFERDLGNVLTLFNDKGINVNVTDIKVEDTSDVLTLKETYTVSLEDENRKRHTIKVNIPKFIDDKFLYLNGNKVLIKKQFASLPVIKTKPDEVQVCSAAYQKMFITRAGSRFNPNMERFKKVLMNKEYDGISCRKGNNVNANVGKLTCLEYDELAARYTEIVIGDCHFIFNVDKLTSELGGGYESSLGKYLVGYREEKGNKIPIYYDQKNEDHVDLISTMILEGKPDIYTEFKAKGFGKKYIYANAIVMTKKIPMVVLLCFFEGLGTVIEKFGDDTVKIVDKKSNRDNYMYIPFKNGYLQYPMSNMEACLMFNGLTQIPTAQYDLSEMDDRETYIGIFEYLFGSAYVIGGLLNFYDFMIDPITLETLRILSLPEDLVSLLIYATNLLADNQCDSDLAVDKYRIRDNEIIPAILYYELTRAYSGFRSTANSKTQKKLSVDPNCVIKALNNIPTVSDYSTLSPILEYRDLHTASLQGYNGMNVEDAYTEKKRVYHDSMAGIVGMSTDIAGNTGKERHLVMEPNVKNVRGMMDITPKEDRENLDYTKLQTGIESLVPGGMRHDDDRRTAMAVKQKGHMIPVKNQSSLLITNGFDSTIHQRTSDDFSVVAEENGKVIDYDNTSKIMIIQYASGKKKAIDLDQKQVKNGNGGIYLRNQKVSSYKVGDSFKKGDIIAYDKYFYKDNGPFGNRLVNGTLVKSACIMHTSTYEDSTWFTSRLAREMSTDISMHAEAIVGKNASVDFIVKPGDIVKIGDPLIRFETSYDHDELNDLLGTIRDDLKEEIINFGKTNVTSHYAGVIDDVIAYSAVDLDQLSPSLRKAVESTLKAAKSKRKILNKHDDDNTSNIYKLGILMNKPEGKVEPDQYGKIGGKDVGEGVRFVFCITYHDELGDGDKLVHMTANKATCGYKIPEGYEPRTPFRPYEEISIPQPPSAILQRGTPSILTTMCGYKVLIELKRKLYEILTGEDWNEKAKRENPEMVLVNDISENASILDNCYIVDNKLLSESAYMVGDILYVEEEADEIFKWLKENDSVLSYKEPNVKYNSTTREISAIEPIYPNEVLRIDF